MHLDGIKITCFGAFVVPPEVPLEKVDTAGLTDIIRDRLENRAVPYITKRLQMKQQDSTYLLYSLDALKEILREAFFLFREGIVPELRSKMGGERVRFFYGAFAGDVPEDIIKKYVMVLYCGGLPYETPPYICIVRKCIPFPYVILY